MMKTKTVSFLFVFFLLPAIVFAQSVITEKFAVKGNCDLCKNRIETAARSVEGVTAADWNMETKILAVSFDPSRTNVHSIQMAIANTGHDTPMHKAKQEVYDKLPGCCKYRR
ncbi:MAG: heavy-metal-associated domain-containing protein [Pseudomonadota bacterium]